MIFYLGHSIDLVDEKIVSNRNTQKSWKYGYDKDHDLIIISKDGTLGPIFYVNGLHIGLPAIPEDHKAILNWDKTVKNQRWKRAEPPKGLNEKTQYNPEFEDYILEEIRRRNQGVWVYIKGQPVYMPGSSYFFYQWNVLDEGYPYFRIIQNELLIYWEACKADNRCYGIDYVKNRRWGWSAICNSEHLNLGTANENKEQGIISKSGTDAKKLFIRLVGTFKKLICFFRPVWDGTSTPKTELVFSEPARRKKQVEDEKEMDEGLDTTIRWHNTTLNAMDGDKIFLSSIDEAGKWTKECPFDEYWRIVKTSHRQGKRIVGKAMVGSTVNSKKKGGREFEKVYNQSDPLKRNKNGQTISGLYRLFIDVIYGMEGYIDRYGFAIIDDPEKPTLNDLGEYVTIGAITHWENEEASLKNDPEGLNEFYRQNPRTIEHAFRDESDDCEFNLNKLLEQISYNKHESNHDDYGSDGIERGNFTWKNGIQDTEVIWNPDPKNGRFWIKKGCHPPEKYRNKKELKTQHGITAWAPLFEELGALGGDPYNRDKGADGRGSKGAIHLFTKPNTVYPSNTFILEYIDRPKTVELFFEDVIMAMVYFSMPILGELSNEAFLTTLLTRGYRHYSLNNPFKKYADLTPTEKKLGGAPAQGDTVANGQMYAMLAFVEDHVGIATSDTYRPVGTMGDMVFNRTLEQIKNVDLKERTKYDAYISSSLSLLANKKLQIKKTEDREPKRNPFTQYDNSGASSIAI